MTDHPATDGTTEELPVTWEGRAKNGARFNVRFSDLLALLEELDVPQSLALTDVVLPETSKRLRAALSAQQSAERELSELRNEIPVKGGETFATALRRVIKTYFAMQTVVEAARRYAYGRCLLQELLDALRALDAATEGDAPKSSPCAECGGEVRRELVEVCSKCGEVYVPAEVDRRIAAATEGGKTSVLCAKCAALHTLPSSHYDHDFEPYLRGRCGGSGTVATTEYLDGVHVIPAPPQTEGEKPCEKCGGAGWVWWNELEHYEGPALQTGVDDTRYLCDRCHSAPPQTEGKTSVLGQCSACRGATAFGICAGCSKAPARCECPYAAPPQTEARPCLRCGNPPEHPRHHPHHQATVEQPGEPHEYEAPQTEGGESAEADEKIVAAAVHKAMGDLPVTPARRRGRPSAGEEGRSAQVTAKITPSERRACEDAARAEGKTLSEWARDALLLRAAAHG